MKTLVTGGAGFVGSHLVDALIDGGHEVIVVDRLDATPERKNDKAVYVKTDILEGVEQIFAAHKPELVFHLAAHIDDRASVENPLMNAEENILGSLNVFEAARKHGVKKILFASTGVTYGAAEAKVFTEKVAPKPLTPYAISKLACEHYLSFYQHKYGIPFVALRIANVYGPRQDGSKECGAIAIFTSKLLKGEAPFMNNDGQTVRDYIFVGDVVAAFVAASQSQAIGVFNCGTGKGTTTAEIYALVSSNLASALTPIARPEVGDAVKKAILKSKAAKIAFDWKPKTGLKKGIRQTVRWYKKQV